MTNEIIIEHQEYDDFYIDRTGESLYSTGSITIDWGDGTTETTNNNTYSHSHNYHNFVYDNEGQTHNGDITVTISGVEEIRDGFLYNNYYGEQFVDTVVIPNNITSIGDNFCYNQEHLHYLTLSNSLTTIGDGFCYGCYLSNGLELPDSLTSIGDNFCNVTGMLSSLTLPDNITTIGDHFCTDSVLTSFTVSNSITSIGDHFLNGCSLITGSIVIPSSVESIGHDFLAGCGMTSIIFENNSAIDGIPDYFACRCMNLTNISFPDNIEIIGAHFCCDCPSLTRVEFPEGLIEIRENFLSTEEELMHLNKLIFPSSFRYLHEGLMGSSIDKVIFKSVIPVDMSAGYPEQFESMIIHVPKNCTDAYANAFTEAFGDYGEDSLSDPNHYRENLTLPETAAKFGTLMRTNLKKQGIETQRNDGLTTLANKVSDIQDFNDIFEFDSSNDYASDGFSIMYASEDIKRSYFTLKVPSTITTLGDYSFDGFHGMRICEIPSSVTSIGNYVFNFNQSLEKIIFKGTTPPTATSRSSFVTNSNSTQNIPTTCVIEVPCSALSAYKSATNYPDPTVYTYQCILFDDKKDHNNSTIAPLITVYDSSQNGVTKINYDSETNSYELFGTSQDKVIYPINQLGGKSNFKMTCEVKLDNSSSIPGIGFGVTPPELSLTGGGQIDDTYADIIYIRSLANGNTQMVYYKSKRSAVTATTIQTISGEYTDWIRLIVNVDSSNGLSAQCEELDGTVLATITNKTISSQISDRNYGIFLRDGGDVSKIQYIRNIKCIGY